MSTSANKDPFTLNSDCIEQISKDANRINERFKDFFNDHKIYLSEISFTQIVFRGINYKLTFEYETKYARQFGGLLFTFNDGKEEVHSSIENLIEFITQLNGSAFVKKICDEERIGLERTYQIILAKYLDNFFTNYNHRDAEKLRDFLKSKYPFYN